MKEPGISIAITLSFFLHIAIITFSFLIGRGLHTHRLVSPYTVSLVYPSQTVGSEQVSPSGATPEAAAPEIAKPAEKPHAELHTETRHNNKADTAIVKNRIEELRAIKKIEKMLALRKMIDIGAGQRAPQSKNSSGAAPGSNIKGSGGDYYSMAGARIREHWIYPETLDTALETVVSIRVAKDGSITIEKIEKGSGNSLFDRSVLRAINMSSPLPPPLKEMEIGLKFSP